MPDAIDLTRYLDALVIPTELDREWLMTDFLRPLGIEPNSALAEMVEDLVLDYFADEDEAFAFRPGGWKVNVVGTAVKLVLTAAILAASMSMAGVTDIPAELLMVVAPLLVDVKQVRLGRNDEWLLVPLRAAAKRLGGPALTAQSLYQELDPAVRAEVNYSDFLACCDRLIAAGHADDAGAGLLSIRQEGDTAWLRVTWE